jgi:hypothetical protein
LVSPPPPPSPPPASRARGLQPRPLRPVAITTFKSLDSIQFELPEALPPDTAAILTSDSIEPPSAPCLLILGENATGKSSILEAIALACLPDDMRDALRLEPVGLRARRLTLNPEYMGAAAILPRADATVEVSFHGAQGRPPQTLGIQIDRDGAPDGPDGGFHPFGDADGPRPLVFAYGPNRLYGRATRPDHTRIVDTLFDGTLHVSNPEAWLLTLKDRTDCALNQIAAALRHIIQIDGAFSHIKIAPDPDDGMNRVWINLRRALPDGGVRDLRQRLDHASSGYRAVLALVCDVFARLMADPDVTSHDARLSRAIILIDEVEVHLHPRWKLQIIDGLRKALPRATGVLTSHDPLCVRGMRPGEVMMLNRHISPHGAISESVERVRDFGAFELMTMEQLLTSDMFRLVSVDDQKAERRYAELAAAIRAGTARAADTDARTAARTAAPDRAEAAVRDFLRDLLA